MVLPKAFDFSRDISSRDQQLNFSTYNIDVVHPDVGIASNGVPSHAPDISGIIAEFVAHSPTDIAANIDIPPATGGSILEHSNHGTLVSANSRAFAPLHWSDCTH